jgi:protein O-GlcNAc transferase
MAISMHIDQLLHKANRCLKAGSLESAALHLEAVLRQTPSHQDALHLLGMIHHLTGSHAIAKQMISRALELKPDSAKFQESLGEVHFALSEFDQAERCQHRALALNPNNAQGWYLLGKVSEARNEIQQAAAYFEKAIKLDPLHASAIYKIAMTHYRAKRYDEAIYWYQKAAEFQPLTAPIHNGLGLALYKRGAHLKALASFDKALKLQPQFAEPYNNKGLVFKELDRIDEALASFEQAFAVKPDYAEAYINAGTLLYDRYRLDAAVAMFRKAIETKVDFSEAYNNLGSVLQYQGHTTEAEELFKKAAQVDPENRSAHCNLAIVHRSNRKLDKAIAAIQRVLSIDPHDSQITIPYYEQLRDACDWDSLKVVSDRVDELTREALKSSTKPLESPFLNLTRSQDMAQNLAVARAWSADLKRQAQQYGDYFKHYIRRSGEKITLGYLSDGFRDHPGTHMVRDIFRLHDRRRFNVYCYSYGINDGNPYRLAIERGCDRFVDVSDLDDLAIAQKIYTDGCNILIDLKGYTYGSRLMISALRPAPIQVRYLGMLGSTGSSFYDYIVTDRIVTPPEFAPFYSEKFAYMPDCYRIASEPPKSKATLSRIEAGLPTSGFIFCSFCSSYKIDAMVFDAWMRILRRVKGSYLWLLQDSREFETNVLKRASLKGIEAHRIVFANRCRLEDHLIRLKNAGLALDTTIVSGAATTSDALWAGVPVTTLPGGHSSSRMSASILSSIGLERMISHNLKVYEELAVHFANDPDELHTVKKMIDRGRLRQTLFNTNAAVRNLERLLTKMWDLYKNGAGIQDIDCNQAA